MVLIKCQRYALAGGFIYFSTHLGATYVRVSPHKTDCTNARLFAAEN